MNDSKRGPVSAAIATLPTLENSQLARLFAEHYRRVLMAGYRITGDMADAEDVAQGVFLRLGASAQPDMTNAASYFYRAAINGALDLLRRKKTVAAEPLESASGVVLSEAAASPEAAMANQELGRHLRHAIGELAPRAAEMFALRYLEDLSNREIAKVMETSQAVVAVTLYQSRLKLKRRLIELQREMR
jgi:RNA polymerase sigma factor (sigma-70 family)